MKLFYTLILCLCAGFVYSQTEQQTTVADGDYIFKKATFTVLNYDGQSIVDTHDIDDPKMLDKTEIFYYNVFLEATIYNGFLQSCVLPDQQPYSVKDGGGGLIPAKEYEKDEKAGDIELQLAPYSFSAKGNELTFIVCYLYGDSRYSFPLEGKLTLVLTKQ
ncbi:hypothetical protein [Dysgonomonas macrotermitis]|uniref:Uncharacterized protein n=1 Tax=Dysgonomonas macrotermitis TaxID=1346286 RepID=A0A1M5BSN8_9BACT|nr:hypothetical protein [Dysgonomonas macrotermitis]SHF45262.1 hypothetical protein SAMN05444362_106172 [Dysgonomonas macrotermitis]